MKPSDVTSTLRSIVGGCVLLLAGTTCSGTITAPDLYGEWGGEHVALRITPQGGVLEYDCAHGSIDPPITPDDQGRFDVTGIHIVEHGGPVRDDEVPEQHPASYRGWTNGSRMVLELTLLDSGVELGPFALERNRPPQIFKCL